MTSLEPVPRLYRSTQGGITRESLEEEGANTIKNIHNEKASRPLAVGLGEPVRGVWGCLGPCPSGRLGVCLGVSRPRPRVEVGGSAWGGGGVKAQARGVPGPGPGVCLSQHALRQTPPSPPQQTATAADGTHPTGMHSCLALCQW